VQQCRGDPSVEFVVGIEAEPAFPYGFCDGSSMVVFPIFLAHVYYSEITFPKKCAMSANKG
jgi:hypothetical protein